MKKFPKFVSGGTTSVEAEKLKPEEKHTVKPAQITSRRNEVGRNRNANKCFHCGQKDHPRRMCSKFKQHICDLWSLKKCHLEPSKFGEVWIAKSDLYERTSAVALRVHLVQEYQRNAEIDMFCGFSALNDQETEEVNLFCGFASQDQAENQEANVAYTTTDTDDEERWYFDSGCSRHMTGSHSGLEDFTEISSGKVTFGDGGKGKIMGKGTISATHQPH